MADWDAYNLPDGNLPPRPSKMEEWKDLVATKKVVTSDGRSGAMFGDEWIFERLVECGVEMEGWNKLTSAQRERMKSAVRGLSLLEAALRRASHDWAPDVRQRALGSLRAFNLWSKERAARKGNFESGVERAASDSPLKTLFNELAAWLRAVKETAPKQPGTGFLDADWRKRVAAECTLYLKYREGIGSRTLTCHERDIDILRTEPPTRVAAAMLSRAFPGATADEIRRRAGAKKPVGRKAK